MKGSERAMTSCSPALRTGGTLELKPAFRQQSQSQAHIDMTLPQSESILAACMADRSAAESSALRHLPLNVAGVAERELERSGQQATLRQLNIQYSGSGFRLCLVGV